MIRLKWTNQRAERSTLARPPSSFIHSDASLAAPDLFINVPRRRRIDPYPIFPKCIKYLWRFQSVVAKSKGDTGPPPTPPTLPSYLFFTSSFPWEWNRWQPHNARSDSEHEACHFSNISPPHLRNILPRNGGWGVPTSKRSETADISRRYDVLFSAEKKTFSVINRIRLHSPRDGELLKRDNIYLNVTYPPKQKTKAVI